ncbi:MAG: periplasmic heavy metal sensor [Labilithrix sp.]|nr:periplasmic heavy metal sensor [Labilithrix sp.]
MAALAGVIGVFAVVRGLALHRRFGGGGGPWALAACGPSFGGRGGRCDGRDAAGWGRGGWGRRGWGGWGRSGGLGGSFWLRAVFARLDTTPGQEREIRGALEDLQRTARDARDGLKGARADLARAVRGESFDRDAAAEAGGRADAAVATAKDAALSALERVHAVLDPHQRERLAALLAEGPGGGRRRGGPYRDAAS